MRRPQFFTRSPSLRSSISYESRRKSPTLSLKGILRCRLEYTSASSARGTLRRSFRVVAKREKGQAE